MLTLSRLLVAVVAVTHVAASCPAGLVGPSDFTSNATIENYDGLPAASYGTFDSGFSIGNVVYESLIHGKLNVVDSQTDLGAQIGRAGGVVATRRDIDTVRITLPAPVTHAGLYVGTNDQPWSVVVEFRDNAGALLGSIAYDSQPANTSQFAGWATNSPTIAEIIIVDDHANTRVIMLDELMTDIHIVDVPASNGLAIAIVALALPRRRRRRCHRK